MAELNYVNKGILNDFTIRPKNLTQYTAFRGVTDFTQIGQFDQYETGYSFLSVIEMPKFMTMLGKMDSRYQELVTSFQHMLEFEFRGLDGLEDITADTMEITDGIASVNMINKVNMPSAITVSMNYFERRGSLITKFAESYLTGIKDGRTQAKTYHGLVKNNLLEPGFENEVFTMLYYVTDNTMLRLEKSVLLCNMQLNKAEISMYNSTKGEIGNREMTLEFSAFPVTGYEVDKAAKVMLEEINGVNVSFNDNNKGKATYSVNKSVQNPAALDSSDYLFAVLNQESPDAIDKLTDAMDRA